MPGSISPCSTRRLLTHLVIYEHIYAIYAIILICIGLTCRYCGRTSGYCPSRHPTNSHGSLTAQMALFRARRHVYAKKCAKTNWGERRIELRTSSTQSLHHTTRLHSLNCMSGGNWKGICTPIDNLISDFPIFELH
jgi:hypothetical protein